MVEKNLMKISNLILPCACSNHQFFFFSFQQETCTHRHNQSSYKFLFGKSTYWYLWSWKKKNFIRLNGISRQTTLKQLPKGHPKTWPKQKQTLPWSRWCQLRWLGMKNGSGYPEVQESWTWFYMIQEPKDIVYSKKIERERLLNYRQRIMLEGIAKGSRHSRCRKACND